MGYVAEAAKTDTKKFPKGSSKNNLDIWPPDWDAQLGAERAVWQATQAIRNDAARPSPASQMFKLFLLES